MDQFLLIISLLILILAFVVFIFTEKIKIATVLLILFFVSYCLSLELTKSFKDSNDIDIEIAEEFCPHCGERIK